MRYYIIAITMTNMIIYDMYIKAKSIYLNFLGFPMEMKLRICVNLGMPLFMVLYELKQIEDHSQFRG